MQKGIRLLWEERTRMRESRLSLSQQRKSLGIEGVMCPFVVDQLSK
ncbi:unnamed protein product, partial [Heterotrigona itama]